MTTSNQLRASGVNDTRLNDLEKLVGKLGGEFAEGQDSMPKLALAVVEAASDGVINTEKYSDETDDAERLFAKYAEGAGKKAIHERTEGGKKANVSKLRQLIKAGGKPTCDFRSVLNRGVEIRQEMAAAKEKVKPAYHSYVDMARAQNDVEGDLTDEQIKDAIRKPEAAEQTELQVLKRAHKAIEQLITGEKGLKDQDERTIQAEELLRARIAALMLASEQQEILAKAAALGMVVTQQGNEPKPEAEVVTAAEAAEIERTLSIYVPETSTETVEAEGLLEAAE